MSLIPILEINSMTGILGQMFNQFSRNIIIVKEPLKTFVSPNSGTYAGYGEDSIPGDVTYTPVSGIFPAKINYINLQEVDIVPGIKVSINAYKGLVRIKVKNDAKEYIENGKTSYILIDDKPYDVISNPRFKNFLGYSFYYYELGNIS